MLVTFLQSTTPEEPQVEEVGSWILEPETQGNVLLVTATKRGRLRGGRRITEHGRARLQQARPAFSKTRQEEAIELGAGPRHLSALMQLSCITRPGSLKIIEEATGESPRYRVLVALSETQ